MRAPAGCVALAMFSWALPAGELTTAGTRFRLDGKPFPYTGISFFNAVHNEAFNESSADRRQWLAKFQKYGINVLRIWGQWDSKRGFVDTCPECSLYQPNGELRPGPLARLKEICADADAAGMVIELAMFSQESWHDGDQAQFRSGGPGGGRRRKGAAPL